MKNANVTVRENPAVISNNKPGIWNLRFYVAGRSPRTAIAFNNLENICEEYISGQYSIEVVDLMSSQDRAFTEVVPAIPVLVRKLPGTIRKIIDSLFCLGNMLVGLDLYTGVGNYSAINILKRVRFSELPAIVFPMKEDDMSKYKSTKGEPGLYITKQIKRQELLKRINPLPRRKSKRGADRPLVLGTLTFNPRTFQMLEGDKEINLTRTEGLIMEHLMRNPGEIITHVRLAEVVWGTYFPDVAQSLKVYIHRLREKIETDPNQPRIIMTKSGYGYYIAKPPENKMHFRKNGS